MVCKSLVNTRLPLAKNVPTILLMHTGTGMPVKTIAGKATCHFFLKKGMLFNNSKDYFY